MFVLAKHTTNFMKDEYVKSKAPAWPCPIKL